MINLDRLYQHYLKEYQKHVTKNAKVDIKTKEIMNDAAFRTAFIGQYNDLMKEETERRGIWKKALKNVFASQRIGVTSLRQTKALLMVSDKLAMDYTFDDIMYHQEVKDALLNAIKFRGELLKAKGCTSYEIRDAIRDAYFYFD